MPIPFERFPRYDRMAEDEADALEMSAMPDDDEFEDELEQGAAPDDEDEELLGSALTGDDEFADDYDDETRGSSFGFGVPPD